MKDSNYLKKGDTIAVMATSDGVTNPLDIIRFNNGKKKLEDLGYKVEFSKNVFEADEKGRSCSGKLRGEIFNEIIRNPQNKVLIAAKGGNFLNEMLEYVDYEYIRGNPIWFQGYSDNTGLIHTLTTKCNIASIYGSNFSEFGMECWHSSVENNLSLLEGKSIIQTSFDKYQKEFKDRVTGLEGYENDCDVLWKSKKSNINISGRMLGGCLDVLLFLQGTKYDGTLEFINKYKEDGIIWYLESFDTTGENLMMFLWQLKEIGWFKYSKGFLFGRPLFYKNFTDTTYEEAVNYAIGDLDVPIIFDCDFGHLGPRMTIVNGGLCKIKYKDGIGKIERAN